MMPSLMFSRILFWSSTSSSFFPPRPKSATPNEKAANFEHFLASFKVVCDPLNLAATLFPELPLRLAENAASHERVLFVDNLKAITKV